MQPRGGGSVYGGMKQLLVALALVAVTASTAAAQRGSKAEDDTRALPGKIKVLDMSEEEIEGGVPTGSGLDATVRAFMDFGSLIRIRTNFIAEIVKAGDDV